MLLASAIWFAVLALAQGQDATWDLRNYHFYNPFALLTGRTFWDIQPAMRQTYFNPFLDVPFYLLATRTSPLITSVVLAVVQSLTLTFAYFIARRLLRPSGLPARGQIAFAGALALAGAASPLSVYEIGLTRGDNTTGVLIVAALLLAVILATDHAQRDVPPRRIRRLAWLAGLLAGAAVGLKLTNAIYAGGLAAAFGVLALPVHQRVLVIGSYAVGGLGGALCTAGIWWWMTWSAVGNPIFPQFNHVFESPWAPAVPFTDETFKADGLLRHVFYPFAYNELWGGEIGGKRFMDARLPVLYVLAVAWLIAALPRGRRPPREPRAVAPYRSIAVFAITSYVLWLAVFSIDRYALLLELLAPVTALSLLWLVLASRRAVLLGSGLVLVVFAFTFRPLRGDRLPFRDDYFGVQLPDRANFDDALFVIASHDPVAYVIPSFPSSARFVRIAGNLHYTLPDLAERYANRMGEEIRRVLDEHDGEVYVLTSGSGPAGVEREISLFGLELETTRPLEIRSTTFGERLLAFPARRHASGDERESAHGGGADPLPQ